MKDLKYLYEFEKLLESANNPLVQQACAEGKHALAYTCYHMPEVLLNTGDCFSVRLRAPLTGSLDISSYYMSNFICDYCKSLLERGIEGGYNFLSALLATETCSEMNRALEHFELLHLVDNEQFFVTFLDMPFKVTDNTVRHYVDQLRRKVLEPLHEVYGVDVSDDALRKAVAEHNEVCRILTEIGQFRKEENPRITGYEYHILNLVSYCCPKYLIVDKLRETLEELREGYERLFEGRKAAEKTRGLALAGPHKDDFCVQINGRNARLYASQGQQRTAVLALKLAEGELSRRLTGEYPVFLFDDILSELDAGRRAYLLGSLGRLQVIITGCETEPFDGFGNAHTIRVKEGQAFVCGLGKT